MEFGSKQGGNSRFPNSHSLTGVYDFRARNWCATHGRVHSSPGNKAVRDRGNGPAPRHLLVHAAVLHNARSALRGRLALRRIRLVMLEQ